MRRLRGLAEQDGAPPEGEFAERINDFGVRVSEMEDEYADLVNFLNLAKAGLPPGVDAAVKKVDAAFDGFRDALHDLVDASGGAPSRMGA